MKGMVGKNKEYRVVDNKAYLTISEAGKLLGVTRSAVKHAVKSMGGDTTEFIVNGRQIKHLGGAVFSELVTKYSSKTAEALLLLQQTAKAGMTVFLYGSAGVALPQAKSVTSDTLALSTDIELKKLEKEKTKQLEIEAKVKLGRKKTGIRRVPKCGSGFTTMKAFERYCEDVDQPIPMSFLTGILNFYALDIDRRANCIHSNQFDDKITDVFNSLVEDGPYFRDPVSKLRVLASKISWFV